MCVLCSFSYISFGYGALNFYSLPQATGPLPNLAVVESLQRIAWAAGIGGLAFLNQPEQIHQLYCQPVSMRPPEMDDTNLVRESLEVL